jgi:predicted GIY-YIG superfamily endonuclease
MNFIYCIENLTTKRKYIGSTTNICERFKTHTKELDSRKHYNAKLVSDWHFKFMPRYVFKFSIIEQVKLKHNLLERENFYILKYKNNCYNIIDAYKNYLNKKQGAFLKYSNKIVNQFEKRYKRGCNN